MPTLQSINFPTPKNWDDFESICLSSFKIRWKNPNLTKNGRHGQAQHGVDIYGVNHLGDNIGIQCKKYDGALTIKTVMAEIENATKFEPGITSFYFATTAPSDAKLQKEIRGLSDERKLENLFSVEIFFWDDIIRELITDEDVFKSHYPNFSLKEIVTPQRTLALFDLAYRGLSFKSTVDLILGEMSEDKKQILVLCTMIESAAKRIMQKNDFEVLNADLIIIQEQIKCWFREKEMTEESIVSVQVLAEQVVNKINATHYDLEPNDFATFRLASEIIRWDYLQTEGKIFDEKYILELLHILFNKVPDEMLELIDSCKNDDSIMKVQYPHRFFVLCRKHFRQHQLLK